MALLKALCWALIFIIRILLLISRFIFCSLASLALLPKTISLHLEVLRVKRLAPNQRDKFCRSF